MIRLIGTSAVILVLISWIVLERYTTIELREDHTKSLRAMAMLYHNEFVCKQALTNIMKFNRTGNIDDARLNDYLMCLFMREGYCPCEEIE